MIDGFFIDPAPVRETGNRASGPAMGTVMEDCRAEADGLVTAKVEYELGEKGKKTRKALVALEYAADKGGTWFLPEVGDHPMLCQSGHEAARRDPRREKPEKGIPDQRRG